MPEILLSGDHGKIEAWRAEQRLRANQRTRRPDLVRDTLPVEADHRDGLLDPPVRDVAHAVLIDIGLSSRLTVECPVAEFQGALDEQA